MIEHPQLDSRRPAITPQLALRVAIMGGLALVLFAVVFFRLWYLQVLSGDQYVQAADDNQVRELRVQAPRGQVVDRNGELLVDSRRAVVVSLDASKLPPVVGELVAEYNRSAKEIAEREQARRDAASAAVREARDALRAKRNRRTVQALSRARAQQRALEDQRPGTIPLPELPRDELELRRLYQRLGRVLGMSVRRIHRRVTEQQFLEPYNNITLKTDVPRTVLNYLAERQGDFPGVKVEQRYLRYYPKRELAAQLFGTVGEISETELEEDRYRGVTQGTIVGKGGIEKVYDRYLRGRDGKSRVQVDSLGRPKGELSIVEPVPGKQLKLSIDLGLQKMGQQALGVGRALARRNGNPAPAGAFVALDPRNGEVLAMGSYPDFDPNVLSRPISPEEYKALADPPDGNAALFNRATAGLYPTGSTFKVVTALAGLDAGLVTPETVVNDPGFIKISDREFQNAGRTAHGAVSMRRAIEVSSDVYFYLLGRDANGVTGGNPIVTWARRLGLGKQSGIDLPDEYPGFVPNRATRDKDFRKYLRCVEQKRLSDFQCAAENRFANRIWTVGDSVNLSIGQGDLQATPLQMAVAYAAVANGGKRVRPHLGLEVEDNAGRVLQKIEPAAPQAIRGMSSALIEPVRDGLRLAAQGAGGTSTGVFEGWPHNRYPVYGKTGTAQRPGQGYDQSWYVCYVPDAKRPIVLAVTVEKGGFGGEAAAPAARLMLSEWFGVSAKVVEGEKAD